MLNNTSMRGLFYRPWQSIIILLAFIVNTLEVATPIAQADPAFGEAREFRLPAPGVMVQLSPEFNPLVLKGIKLDPKNPFRFHFFVDTGDDNTVIPAKAGIQNQEQLKQESTKLIKYFLASLTIPEKDLWVNLSPYEKDRIVPLEFGQTEMGRDLLAEDYILKQITASLIYPESKLGKEFWAKVYAQAQSKYGTTNIPINTFNKVWIVPEKAVVYENGGVAFVLENHLKVMLEQDYLSLSRHQSQPGDMFQSEQQNVSPSRLPTNEGLQLEAPQGNNPSTNELGSQIVREIVIPALTKEVNQGKNFAQLRQVFYSLILATWYKKKIKDSILNKVYSNRKRIMGLSPTRGHVQDRTTKNMSSSTLPSDAGLNARAPQENNQSPESANVEYIYQQYLKAFKKGVFNYIKEEPNQITRQTIPRKYFSGGIIGVPNIFPTDQISRKDLALLGKIIKVDTDFALTSKVPGFKTDLAMLEKTDENDVKTSAENEEIIKRITDDMAFDELVATKGAWDNVFSRYSFGEKLVYYHFGNDDFHLSKIQDGDVLITNDGQYYWNKLLPYRKREILNQYEDTNYHEFIFRDGSRIFACVDAKIELEGRTYELSQVNRMYQELNWQLPKMFPDILTMIWQIAKDPENINLLTTYEKDQLIYTGIIENNGKGFAITPLAEDIINSVPWTWRPHEWSLSTNPMPRVDSIDYKEVKEKNREQLKNGIRKILAYAVKEGFVSDKKFSDHKVDEPNLRDQEFQKMLERFFNIHPSNYKFYTTPVPSVLEDSDIIIYNDEIFDAQEGQMPHDLSHRSVIHKFYRNDGLRIALVIDSAMHTSTQKPAVKGQPDGAMKVEEVKAIQDTVNTALNGVDVKHLGIKRLQLNIKILSESETMTQPTLRHEGDIGYLDYPIYLGYERASFSREIVDSVSRLRGVPFWGSLLGKLKELDASYLPQHSKNNFERSFNKRRQLQRKWQSVNDFERAILAAQTPEEIDILFSQIEHQNLTSKQKSNLQALAGQHLNRLPDDYAMKTPSPKTNKALDAAMRINREGGINLNPAQMNLQVKKEGDDFKFNFNGREIDAAQVSGATFTIRTITPVTDLPQILGLNL